MAEGGCLQPDVNGPVSLSLSGSCFCKWESSNEDGEIVIFVFHISLCCCMCLVWLNQFIKCDHISSNFPFRPNLNALSLLSSSSRVSSEVALIHMLLKQQLNVGPPDRNCFMFVDMRSESDALSNHIIILLTVFIWKISIF